MHSVTVNYTSAVCIAAAVAALAGPSRRYNEIAYHVTRSHALGWSEYHNILRSYGYELKMVSVDAFCEGVFSSSVKLSKTVDQFREFYVST
ncbi:hypothetical protein BOTBODRAFT_350893 [Botryobasidium botryosum FD-172 SS1]|uniref:Uncharacterized protein n=1 Tax=Botryobasidium botryosum (strain FD-172 SS1) TaxID=930990 RepID=A0A067MR62_BOTB1|nr:hypothetical protein BOTBODRAFT_350893 [Botryobasidium botryosum FD-172 SS1]